MKPHTFSGQTSIWPEKATGRKGR